MIDETNRDAHSHWGCHKCISWTAVIVGAFVGIGLSFLLNLFAVSIGMSSFTNTSQGAENLAIGGFIGFVVIAIVSMFMCGWVAGFLGKSHNDERHLGELYGFTAWALALILTIFLASPVARFVDSFNHSVNPYYTSTVNMNENEAVSTTHMSATEHMNRQTPTERASNQRAVNQFGLAAFVTFFLLFIGALSACFGGRCGIGCRHKENYESRDRSTMDRVNRR